MIVLNSQPLGSVTIPIFSDTLTEGTVSPDSVVFTVDNWDVAQAVTVTGVDDGSPGAVTVYGVITGAAISPGDPGYDGVNPSDVTCTNTMP